MDSDRLFHCCVLCLVFSSVGVVAASPPSQESVVECEPDKARCHDGSLCISKDKFCDRKSDCLDHSDERFCVLGNCTDQRKYFPCAQTSECVPRDFVCDGHNDCADGSDELVCDPKENCTLEHDRFLCADRKSCLVCNKVCDGHADCDDESDESTNCDSSRNACQAGKCGEFGVCKVLPYGPVCICQLGFTLMTDNVTCKDIDECNIHRGRLPCDQECTNTNGSFNCSCLHGYRLENTTHCRVQDPDPVLYVAANTGVLAYHIRSGLWTTVFEDQPDIVDLDFGPNDNLFWTAVNRTSSWVQFRHVGWPRNWTTHTLVDIGLSRSKGVAVDWMTNAVYVVSEDRGQILACVRTKPVSCVVVKENLDKLQDIIICHHSRKMFWSNWGRTPKITSSDLDGRNTAVIVSGQLRQPTGLVMDRPRKTVLWADSLLHRIESSHLDGSHRQIVVSRGLHRPSSLALLEGTLYWANVREGSMSSCNLYNGCRRISLFKNGLHHPNSLVIGSPSLHGIPEDPPINQCQTALCSHVCLSSRPGYSCMCPPDQILTKDGHTCSRTPGTDQLYIGTRGKILVLPQGLPGYTQDLLLPTILSHSDTPSSLEVGHDTNSVVYCDSTKDTITMATTDILTGMVTENTLYEGDNIQHVLDLTVDWVPGNIYWADASPRAAIMVGCISGEHILTLVKDNLEQPNSLDIDHVNGYLYFSDIGRSPFIGRCRLDGTDFSRLNTDVGHPEHLVVSPEDNRLYFMDVHYHQILSVSLPDGADHRTHWQGITGQVLGLAVIDRWIYWTDQQSEGGALCRVHKHDHNKEMCFLRNNYLLQGLAVPSSINSPQVDGCGRNNGGCSHFCFSQGSEVTCKCSDGFILEEDGHACQAVLDSKCVFRCHDGHCITDRSYLCDGQPDCTDGEEEDPSLCDQTTSPTPKSLTGAACQQPNQCHHICRETPKGPRCDCRRGYQLSDDQKGCRDVDECENNNGGCSQLCDNKDGSHSCSCVHGYTKNGSLCHAQEPHPYLVIGGTGGIDKVNDQGQIEELMIGEASGFVTALDVVMETGDIIFVTSVQEALFLYKRTEKNVTRLTTLGSKVTDLSYDWIGRNVYYTDGQHGTLGVCSLQSLPILCRTLRYEPVNSIALHPVIGWMLWTSTRDGTIMRMGMDGRNLTVLVEATVGQSVLALTIDYANDRIYWISSPANQVWSSDMDGKRRQNVLNGVNVRHFSSVSVFENTLYLMDKRSKVVYLYSKPGGQQTGVIQLLSTPSCLRIVHPFQQAHQMTDVCRARRCSHLCLVTPRGANCYCPDGFQFLPGSVKACKDGKTSVMTVTEPMMSTPKPATETLQIESPYRIKTTPKPTPENPTLEPPYQVKTISRSENSLTDSPYKVKTTPRSSTENPQREPPYKVMSSPRLTTDNPTSSTPRSVNLNLPKVAPPAKVHLGIQHVEYHHSNEENLCEKKCENGGKCVIAEDNQVQYCSCVGGYSGATCGDVDAAVQGETTADDTRSIIIGVTSAVAVAIIAVVIISVVCWIKHRSGRSFPDYMPCVARTSKIFTAKEDAEGLVSDSSSAFGDLRFDSDVTFREFDTVSYQTTSSSTDPARCGPNNSSTAHKDQVFNPQDIYYCPSNQSFGSAFCRQEESQDRSSSGASSASSM
ncbi:prolow-density lipoprotein receptor-related protein 1-like [Mizuhopecten yessoensis]|uniref:prolow-density lipoprotein receptor-related protein 1-like n=1 Tax=Mizuhopecten yessoensis TaxID=6573 RepID=UPI000B45DDC7|nr:prolow-density lipoprotein receptor-related protein 1-like [Mizuhopecten yessoensis]